MKHLDSVPLFNPKEKSNSHPFYKNVIDDFCLKPGRSHSITGSGGKTSLIWYLTKILRNTNNKVTVTTTAKMMIPTPNENKFDCFFQNLDEYTKATNTKIESTSDVIMAGVRIPNIPNKIGSFPMEEIPKLMKENRYLLIEADGSKNLPLKWWYDYEPPIFSGSSLIYGVIPINLIGEKLTDENTYNLKGLKENLQESFCTLNLLKEIILRKDGLFKNTYKLESNQKHRTNSESLKRIVVINKCDTDEDFKRAEDLIKLIKEDPRSQFIYRVIRLSIKELNNENYSHYSCSRLFETNESK